MSSYKSRSSSDKNIHFWTVLGNRRILSNPLTKDFIIAHNKKRRNSEVIPRALYLNCSGYYYRQF
jgi:hypothetical protein